jgi:hypothetical protein
MPISAVHKAYAPIGFPVTAFDSFAERAFRALPLKSERWQEFALASHLMLWRFRACTEHRDALIGSWRRFGADIGPEQLFQRERDFFGMLACGVSAIETTVYGCYAVASACNVIAAPFTQAARRRESTPERLNNRLAAEAPQSRLALALDALVSAPQWRYWRDYRNTLTHRTAILPIIRASAGSPLTPAEMLNFPDRWSHQALSGDESALTALVDWLAEQQEAIMTGGAELADTVLAQTSATAGAAGTNA